MTQDEKLALASILMHLINAMIEVNPNARRAYASAAMEELARFTE